MKKTTNKVMLSWKDIESKVDVLAKKLKNDKFDAIVSIGRGGMIPARLLAERLDIHSAYLIDIKAYDKNNRLKDVKMHQMTFASDVHKILIVDDCLFTGTTLNSVMAEIAEHSQIKYIVNAFLYKNIKMQKVPSNFVYAAKYDGNKQWLVFPWEKN